MQNAQKVRDSREVAAGLVFLRTTLQMAAGMKAGHDKEKPFASCNVKPAFFQRQYEKYPKQCLFNRIIQQPRARKP